MQLFRLNNKNLIQDDANEVRKERLVGGDIKMNVNDRHVKELLLNHLPRLLTEDGDQFVIDEICEVTRQIVAGALYKVKGNALVEGKHKGCTVFLLERNWVKTGKINISALCDDGKKYVSGDDTVRMDQMIL